MSDNAWMTIRYALIAIGTFLVANGKITEVQSVILTNGIIELAGLAVVLGTTAWGWYVRYNTATVPKAQAEQSMSVTELSAATGQPKVGPP